MRCARRLSASLDSAHLAPGQRYGAAFPAVRIPARNLWPQKLVTALFHLAAHTTPALSLALHTRTPATSIAPAASNTSARLPRRWAVHTPRGAVQCAYVLHATNAHAAHLVPALAGRVVPTRGQIIATRASAALSALTPSGFTANEGFEYWFPRPPASKEEEERPLVVLGGGREVERRLAFALGETDDGVLDGEVGRVLREFLPGVFPGRYAEGAEPEMEWVRLPVPLPFLYDAGEVRVADVWGCRRGLWASLRSGIRSYVRSARTASEVGERAAEFVRGWCRSARSWIRSTRVSRARRRRRSTRGSTSQRGTPGTACRAHLAGAHAHPLSPAPSHIDFPFFVVRCDVRYSADAVARMIAASITGAALELPAWLPRHYLTTLRPAARTRRELVERRAAEAAP